MKKTAWFPGDENPVREGVYERQSPPGSRLWPYSYWDGRYWSLGAKSVAKAAIFEGSGFRHACQRLPWRGLAKEPK